MRNRAKPKSNKQGTDRDYRQNTRNEDGMMKLITELKSFEEFRSEILPAIQKDLQRGMTAEQLRKKYHAIVQARQITEAITNPDAGKALSAAANIVDRVEGKPKEKVEHTHKFDSLSDAELDAVLESEDQELSDMENRFEQ